MKGIHDGGKEDIDPERYFRLFAYMIKASFFRFGSECLSALVGRPSTTKPLNYQTSDEVY